MPLEGVWITQWITVTNWSWMEKGFVSLKKTRDLVEDLEAVLAPGPGLAVAPGPAAGPGPAAAPGLAAGPGLRTGPSLVTVPSLEVAPSLPPEMPRRMGTKIGPGLAARASLVTGQRTGPSLGTAPGPGLLTDLVHAPPRNQNQSLVQDLVLNPGIKKQQKHYKTQEKKQETTIINNDHFFYGDFEETILYLYQHCIAIQTPINDTTNKPLEFYHFVYQNVYSYLLHYCSFVIITLQYLHIVFLLYSKSKNFLFSIPLEIKQGNKLQFFSE